MHVKNYSYDFKYVRHDVVTVENGEGGVVVTTGCKDRLEIDTVYVKDNAPLVGDEMKCKTCYPNEVDG